MKLTKLDVQKRFHELNGQMKTIEAESKPLRDEINALRAELDQDPRMIKMRKLSKEVTKIEAPLGELSVERSGCVAYLRGQTGTREEIMKDK